MRVEQPYSPSGRPIPRRTPTTAPYFDAAREGRLCLQKCPRDGFFFYPRSACPECLGRDWEWQDVSGRGTVYSFTIDRMGLDPNNLTFFHGGLDESLVGVEGAEPIREVMA